MGADTLRVAASSKPLRGILLVLLLTVSFYLGKPFSGGSSATPKSSSDDRESWITWKPETQKMVKQAGNTSTTFNDAHEDGPRIRQATMIYSTNNYNSVYERAVASHIRHGEQWGVPTHILRHDIVEAGFFNKPAFLLGLVIEEMSKPYGQRSDWIVWFDADSILFNTGVPWNLFLPPPEYRHINFLGSKDQNGFNAGMLLLRVHPWSVRLLAQTLTLQDFKPEIELPFADQSAFVWALERPGFAEHIIYQPHSWWNSFGLQGKPFEHDRFVLHFAGSDSQGGEDKATSMGRWLDIIETDPERYYKPLSNLTLQAEVAEFWEALTKAQHTLQAAVEWSKQSKYNGKDFQDARKDLDKAVLGEADGLAPIKAGITKLENLKAQVDKSAQDSEKASNKKTTKDEQNQSDQG